jgi:hypothetical protein
LDTVRRLRATHPEAMSPFASAFETPKWSCIKR